MIIAMIRRRTEELFVHPNRGSLFESLVVAELLKARNSNDLDADICFWRDNVGREAVLRIDGQGLQCGLRGRTHAGVEVPSLGAVETCC